jgi:hypothetical protein
LFRIQLGSKGQDEPEGVSLRRSTAVAIALGAVVAAVVLGGFTVFWAQDACLDAGGAVRLATRQCELAAGQHVPLFRARSVLGWLHDGTMAVLAASLAIALLVRASRQPGAPPLP